MDVFGVATTFRVGKIIDYGINSFSYTLATSFTGCMSGAKLIIHPLPNTNMRFRKSVEFDLFKLIQTKPLASDLDPNPTGVFPTETLNCGSAMPVPGNLIFHI